MVKKTLLFKSFLSGYSGGNLQKVGKKKRKTIANKNKQAIKKLKAYRKEEVALIKRRKKIEKIMQDKSSLISKPRRLKIHKI